MDNTITIDFKRLYEMLSPEINNDPLVRRFIDCLRYQTEGQDNTELIAKTIALQSKQNRRYQEQVLKLIMNAPFSVAKDLWNNHS